MENHIQSNPSVSIVIPFLNEEIYLLPLYEKMNAIILPLKSDEIISIDEGSLNRTIKVLKKLPEKDPYHAKIENLVIN